MRSGCAALTAALLFLLVPNVILAAPAEQVTLRWAELPPVLKGQQISVRLADRATVEGKYAGLQADALAMRVRKTSDPAAHPKGPSALAKRDVAEITVKRHTGWKARTIGLIAGGATGAAAAGAIHTISKNEVGGWSAGTAGIAAVGGASAVGAGYLIGWLIDVARARPERVVRVLPD
jgi:hypothetical protein